jgi:hypothetical protein
MRRGGRGRGGHADYGKRRVFTKLLKDPSASLSDIYQARRFLEGMETFDSKAELLAVLQDDRNCGMQRISDVLSFTNSVDDVRVLLIPLLGHVMNEETSRPVYQSLRDLVLLGIYNVPGLMSVLVAHKVVHDLDRASCVALCSFLRAIAKSFVEPRESDSVRDLAKALRERGDVDDAKFLCSILMVDEIEEQRAQQQHQAVSTQRPRSVASWVQDMDPPGGRHDNDHLNFRNISIVPSIEELSTATKPYLPLASGENNFIDDPVLSLLDRNFRLLREDAVSSMKENIAHPRGGIWENARIVGLEVIAKGGNSGVSFVIQCDHRDVGSPNWKRSRALMHNSIVALCTEGRLVRMGIITVREDRIPGQWLNNPDGPVIGVTFESPDDFIAAINELIQNRSAASRNSSHLTTYSLIEVSKSFFAYQPILKALQKMETVPLANELLGIDTYVSLRPEYLPRIMTLPSEFGSLRCDLDDWKSYEVEERTTLDRSQAEALRHSLTSRVVLTQGPPGTGKTFLGALVARVI